MLAVTVTDGVRVRSQPRVSSDSRLYQPVLPAGTSLLVADGPVVANGYTWIEVSVLSGALNGGVDTGWVAVADHDGTPWVALDPSAMAGLQLASSSSAQAKGTLAAARQEASQANAFGIALYRKLLASGQVAATKGMVFSPTSIVDALAMARAGAAGATATQMDAVLRANGWNQLSLGIASLDQQLASRNGSYVDENGDVHALSLHLANTAFIQQGFPVESPYLSRLAKTFGAGVALVDFVADTQGAINAINGWVKAQTVGKIPVIVDQNSILPTTRLALVNAIYLKANWAQEFDPGLTASGAFSLFDGTKVSVPTMHTFGGQTIGLASGSGWKATELFYRGPAGAPLEMTLILPDDLRAFEKTMTTGTLATVQAKIAASERSLQKVTYAGQESCGTYPYQVELRLPRFGVDTSAMLGQTLASMGMPLAMTAGAADFSGIAPNQSLYISDVVHKATIDVNEKGTTAAAATVVVLGTGGCTGPDPAKTVSLKFNHPFLFVIRDVKTGAILFIGRVTDPTQR
jgi:serpin B